MMYRKKLRHHNKSEKRGDYVEPKKQLNGLPILVKIFIYSLISTALTLLLFVMCRNWIVSVGAEINNTVSIMLSQVSSTFIVLSLTSVLSTNIGVVYWQDIKDVKLIKPFFFCFYALTTYLITAMVISVIGFFIGNRNLQLSAFVASIILLIALTIKMLGVYFGRDNIKHDLMWEYIKIVNSKDKANPRADHYCKRLLDLYERDLFPFSLRKNEVKELRWLVSINNQDNNEAREDDADKYQGDSEAREKWGKYSKELGINTLQAVLDNNEITANENIDLLFYAGDLDTLYSIFDALLFRSPAYATDMLLIATLDEYCEEEIRSRYAIPLFRILIKEGCELNESFYAALLLSKDAESVKEIIVDIVNSIEDASEMSVCTMEERCEGVTILDSYFPSVEIIEAYYSHNICTCVDIINAAYKIYLENPFVKSDNYSHAKELQFKYLPDDMWDQMEALLNIDKDIKVLPEETKRKLEKMRYKRVKIQV